MKLHELEAIVNVQPGRNSVIPAGERTTPPATPVVASEARQALQRDGGVPPEVLVPTPPSQVVSRPQFTGGYRGGVICCHCNSWFVDQGALRTHLLCNYQCQEARKAAVAVIAARNKEAVQAGSTSEPTEWEKQVRATVDWAKQSTSSSSGPAIPVEFGGEACPYCHQEFVSLDDHLDGSASCRWEERKEMVGGIKYGADGTIPPARRPEPVRHQWIPPVGMRRSDPAPRVVHSAGEPLRGGYLLTRGEDSHSEAQ